MSHHWHTRSFVVALLVVTAWIAPAPRPMPQAQEPQNLLVNPGFEEGFYFADNAPEMQVANGWKPWWIQGRPEETSQGYLHRPEYKAEDRNLFGDRRVRSERYAQKFFTSYSTHHAGFFQRADAPPGSQVTFCIWVQVWSSSKDDPNISEEPGKLSVSVGIDPLGRSDPYYPEVIWAEPVTQYDTWLHLCVSGPVQSNGVTVWTRSVVEWRVVHNDAYWDDATLVVSQPPPTPTPIPTATPVPTPTPLPTPPPSATATPTAPATPTATPSPAPTPLPPAITVHIVRPGETLLALAAEHGSSVDDIAQANGITDLDLIFVDQRLLIPIGQDGIPPLETGVYLTQANESPVTLAYRYHTTVDIVAQVNGILRADHPLPDGLRLNLPPIDKLQLERAVHTIHPGETPLSVALIYNTTVWHIALANDLRFPYLLPAGKSLFIPNR
ncbi:MAG: LysM peptidoglycan-binding domain-containing protein [Chloroflexota bacterium]